MDDDARPTGRRPKRTSQRTKLLNSIPIAKPPRLDLASIDYSDFIPIAASLSAARVKRRSTRGQAKQTRFRYISPRGSQSARRRAPFFVELGALCD